MTPEEVAATTDAPINALGSRWMMHPDLFVAAAQHGYSGFDFYAAGRAGVMGDVSDQTVESTFVIFGSEFVSTQLAAAREVRPISEATPLYLAAAVAWADTHLSDGDHARLADLARRVANAAEGAGMPLFAAWRAHPEPTGSDKQRSLFWLHVLREHRAALHFAALALAGVSGRDAVISLGGRKIAGMFGWSGDLPDPAELGVDRAALAAATLPSAARAYAALTAEERDEFVTLLGELTAPND